MGRALSLGLFLVLVVAVAPARAQAVREWTVMAYFTADDNKNASLEENQVKNLDELCEQGSGAGYDLVVQMDRSNKLSDYLKRRYQEPNYSGATRYHAEKGSWGVVAKLGEVNMGAPQTLLDFMTWAAATYPAKHYLLVINGHGSGPLSWRGPGSTSDTTPGRVQLKLNRYVAYDDTDNDCLTLFELAAALEAFKQVPNGKKLDMLAVDACLAASVEALFQLRDATDLLVASEALVPGSGFDYAKLVSMLAAKPAIDPESLGSAITESFIHKSPAGNVLGCFRTSRADDLQVTCSELARVLVEAGKQVGSVSVQNLTSFGSDKYWDLKRIARSIAEGRTNLAGCASAPELVAAANRVLAVLKASCVSLWYSGSYSEQQVGGLSIFWPDAATYRLYRPYYKALPFSAASLWDEFLDWRELR